MRRLQLGLPPFELEPHPEPPILTSKQPAFGSQPLQLLLSFDLFLFIHTLNILILSPSPTSLIFCACIVMIAACVDPRGADQ